MTISIMRFKPIKRINARVGRNYLRLSPSVFNDMTDIERVLDALA